MNTEKIIKTNYSWAIDNGLDVLYAEDLYDQMLDEVYGEINICDYKYVASDAWKSVDPTAYRCGCADYIDSLLKAGDITQLDDSTLVYSQQLERIRG